MSRQPAASRTIHRRFFVPALVAVMLPVLAAGKDERPAEAEYRESGGSRSLIHVDKFASDELAEQVAAAGRNGNPAAIRAALGKGDFGFVKINGQGYRIDYARRQQTKGGTQILLLFRNELPFAPHEIGNCPSASPIAAATVVIPENGRGHALILGAATVTFRSADDVSIEDCRHGMVALTDLRPVAH